MKNVIALAVFTAAALLSGFAPYGSAAPYRPTLDADVLEQLPWHPANDTDRKTRIAHELLQRDPGNLDVALRLAWILVDRARAESDPRYLGRAQAVLAPWWHSNDPSAALRLLRATIAQSTHAFASARSDLIAAVAQDPYNPQAWLTLASVQQVTGDLANAAHSCERVTSTGATAVGIVCKAALDGLTGNAAMAYDALESLSRTNVLDPSVRVQTWALTLRGELAERLGRGGEAERWYRASLATDPQDTYTIAAYADFLLDEGRSAEVVSLIPQDTRVDTLLLRRAQADDALGTEQATATAREVAGRFAALRERGDRVHLREEARFTCSVLHDPASGLVLALQNWAIQKEPLDARIVLECALAAGQPHASAEVVAWVDRTRLEGVHLAALIEQARAP